MQQQRRTQMSAIPVYIDTGRQKSLKYEQIDAGSSSVTLVPPQGTVLIQVKIEGGIVRYRDDGVDPTPTVGMPLEDGEALIYDVCGSVPRFIEASGDAKINVIYYGG